MIKKMKINFVAIAIIVGCILLVPLIAMQFTDEVVWTLSDFIIAGILLFGAGTIFNFAMIKIKNRNYKIIAGIAILLILFYIWAELAVGIFTNLGS